MSVVQFKKPGDIEVGFTYFDHARDNEPKVIEQTFDELAATIKHVVGVKDGRAISAGLFAGTRGTATAIARALVLLDIEANKKTGEVPPPPEQLAGAIEGKGWRAAIYTSYNHTPHEPRYRVLLDIDRTIFFQLNSEVRAQQLEMDLYAMRIIIKKLGLDGVVDESKLGVASIFFLARVPEGRQADAQVIDIPGSPINVDKLMAAAELQRDQDVAARQAMAEAAAARAASRPPRQPGEGSSIEKLRQVMPRLTDVMTSRGYRYFKAMDRWLHPNSTTGIPGIQVFRGDDGIERLVSFHGCDPLEVSMKAFGTGAHDVVDLEIAWRWGTTADALTQGIKELSQEHGIERTENLDDFDTIEGAVVFDEATVAAVKATVEAAIANKFQWITRANGTPVLTTNWLIKRVLPIEGLGVIYGRPGSGKTFSVMDLAMHVALGRKWRGLKVNQADVSYISPEAGRLGANRVIGWCKHHDEEWPTTFRLSPAAIDLRSSEDDALALIKDIKQNQPGCKLVVIDTLNRAMAGGDENDGQDMGEFVRLCDLIAKALTAFVLVVHHSGKDAAKGSRGHSSLLGAVCLELEVKREQGEAGTIKVTKMRDGEDGAEYGFTIGQVHLGEDEDAEPVTTGIALEADAGEARAVRDARPTGKHQVTVANAFDQYIVDAGRPNPPGIGHAEPGRVLLTDLEPFIEFAAGKIIGGKTWERRKLVKDAIESLVDKTYFCVNDSKIWLPR
jgi:hypothetical protein